MNEPASTPTGSRLALGVLVVLVILSPWPFGSVHPVTRWLITAVCLLTVTGIALVRLRRGEGIEVPTAAMLGAGVFLLGLAQLVPLPPALHGFLAPGSAAIWHPQLPAAAQVLGEGPRPISIWPETTRGAVGLGLGVIALATLAMPALRDRHRAVLTASIVVCSALAVGVYGLVARLAFGDKLFGVLTVPTIAPFGPFVSKNHFAGYVEMSAALAVGLALELASQPKRPSDPFAWLEGPRAGRVVLAYAAAAILCLAVLVSLSRGGALSLAAGVAAFTALRWLGTEAPGSRWHSRVFPTAVVLGAGVAAVLLLPSDARDRLQTMTDGRKDAATAYRFTVWRDSTQLAGASPWVGHGLGTFVDALPRFKTGATDLSIEHAENDYIELLAEGGLIGVGLACGAVLALGGAARRRPNEEPGRHGSALAQGAAAALVTLGVHSVVDFNLRIPSNALLAALLAAALVSRSPRAASRRVAALGFVGVCAVAVFVVARMPASDQPNVLRRAGNVRARVTMTPLRLATFSEPLEEGLRRRPADAEAWVWLGWSRTLSDGPEDAAALVRYGAQLDPQRTALQDAAARLAQGAAVK